MADAILPDLRVAELKKACAAVLRCAVCYEKFVSRTPLADPPLCERCEDDVFAIVGFAAENPRTE